MTTSNLAIFRDTLTRATRFGVAYAFRRRFTKLRRAGHTEAEAAEQALREAVVALNPEVKRGITLVLKEGRS